MKIVLYLLLIIISTSCSEKIARSHLKIITMDQSTVTLNNGDSVTQVLTNQGIKYAVPDGALNDSCFYNDEPCTLSLFSVTAFSLYYEINSHAVYLIEEIYDPEDASEYYVLDTLSLSTDIKNLSFFDPYYHTPSNTVQVHKSTDPHILSHLIGFNQDKIVYYGLHVDNNKIQIIQEKTIAADSVAYALYNHYNDPIVFKHKELSGLLQFHTKAEYSTIEPFKHNYSRAQHRSGVWGYLKNNGTWFPDL